MAGKKEQHIIIYVFLYQNLKMQEDIKLIKSKVDLCISILEFKELNGIFLVLTVRKFMYFYIRI